MTRLFTKTSKNVPQDAESANAKLLVQAGLVHQEMAGVYSWLPLGLRVLRKVEAIIREEMNALGAQEVLLTALQPKENWITTGRWDTVDVLFKVPSQTGKEYALGPTAEDIVTPLVQQFVRSYKDLPVIVYQIQNKFRDELRAKSGVLRGREFGMKDMYSFHATKEGFQAFYDSTIPAYLNVYRRCGLDVKVVEASGGSFTDKVSHEFQVITPAGEDKILACPNCTFAQNIEIATLKEGDACPECSTALILTKGVEAGNIFNLGQRFSEAFKFEVTPDSEEKRPVYMGCYGIGVTRLVGTIVEASHDERGIIWPKTVAPMPVHLSSFSSKDPEVQAKIEEIAEGLHNDLMREGIEVLWDDRSASPGEKLADADLLGLPLRLIVSEKTLKEDAVEWKLRTSSDAQLVKLSDVMEDVTAFVNEI